MLIIIIICNCGSCCKSNIPSLGKKKKKTCRALTVVEMYHTAYDENQRFSQVLLALILGSLGRRRESQSASSLE